MSTNIKPEGTPCDCPLPNRDSDGFVYLVGKRCAKIGCLIHSQIEDYNNFREICRNKESCMYRRDTINPCTRIHSRDQMFNLIIKIKREKPKAFAHFLECLTVDEFRYYFTIPEQWEFYKEYNIKNKYRPLTTIEQFMVNKKDAERERINEKIYHEQQIREQQMREQQMREQQMRNQQMREQKMREQQIAQQQMAQQQMAQQIAQQQMREQMIRDDLLKNYIEHILQQQIQKQMSHQISVPQNFGFQFSPIPIISAAPRISPSIPIPRAEPFFVDRSSNRFLEQGEVRKFSRSRSRSRERNPTSGRYY